jgi:ligand-binding sensor domain-containing protein
MKKILFIMIVVIQNIVFAQTGEWKFIRAEYNDLPYKFADCVSVDSSNNKWFGTEKGIGVFDGTKWTQYNTGNSGLTSNKINKIFTDMYGNVWISVPWNLIKYDGRNWSEIDTSKSPVKSFLYCCPDSCYIYVVRNQNVDDATGYIASMYRYNILTGEWYEYEGIDAKMRKALGGIYGPHVNDIKLDKEKNVWLATDMGLYKINKDTVINYHVNNEYNGDITSFITISFEQDGSIWCGARIMGLYHFINGVFQKLPYEVFEVDKVLVDKKNNKWFKTTEGISMYDNDTLINYTSSNTGILTNGFTDVSIDKNENIWITSSDGVYQYGNDQWSYYCASYGIPSDDINSVAMDKNNSLWICSYFNWVVNYKNGEWIYYNSFNSGIPNFQNKVKIDRYNRKWFVSFNGLSVFDDKDWITYRTNNSDLPSNLIRDVLVTKNDEVYIATNKGLAIIKNGNWEILETSNSSLPTDDIRALSQDSTGGIWIGTYQKGIIRIKEGVWQLFNTTNSGLSNDLIMDIDVDKGGNVWIGTDNGLSRYNGQDWEIYTTNNSTIPNNSIRDVYADNKNNIWLTSWWNTGLAKYNGNEWKYYNNYDTWTGSYGISVSEIVSSENGDLFLATSDNGLGIFNEDTIVSAENQPLTEDIPINLEAYPNPFNSSTNIVYILPETDKIELSIYDILGRRIKQIFNGVSPKGKHVIQINSSELSSGVYICKLNYKQKISARKIMLIK